MSQSKPTILVTGGAGYIGSHVALALLSSGYKIAILDNLVNGHRELVEAVLKIPVIVGDTGDRACLEKIFASHNIEAVMHFAAYAYVGESMVDPFKYYHNNVAKTITLLEAMLAAGVKKLVFSSTCAAYGIPKFIPVSEDESSHPINPYGASKLMVERILTDFKAAYGLESVCFRYFNAAGADPEGRLGEDHQPETHIIPLILLAALGKRPHISIYGTDYPTPDGTCIRDFIHVVDIAKAHILGLQYLLEGGETALFNLGNGNGYSIREIIQAAEQVTGKVIPVIECDRRPGDPPILVGSSKKANSILGWEPEYPQMVQMLKHAWNWHQKRHC